MKKYDIWQKLTENGQPKGHRYKVPIWANSREEAERKARKENADWARRTGFEKPVIVQPRKKTTSRRQGRQPPSLFPW